MTRNATSASVRVRRPSPRATLAFALFVALTGCVAPPAEPPALDTTVAFTRPVVAELPPRASYRVGVNAEITGPGAPIGDLGVRAARLAVEEINAAGGVGGVPIELVVRDSRSDPAVALEQYRLAVAGDGLDALIGPFKSAYAVHIVPEHRGAALPMLIGATNVTLTEQGDANLFRLRPSDRLTAAAMAAFAVDELGARRVAIVHDSDAFGAGGADGVAAALHERGLAPVAREPYRTATSDFDPLVRRVIAAAPDAVLIYGTNNTDVGLLLRALRYRQLAAPIVTSPGGATAVAHSIAGDAQDGIYVALDALLAATPAGERFERRFAERFGLAPDTYVAWYYDAIYLLAAALARGPAGPAGLSAAIRDTPFEGAQGAYRFDAGGDGLHRVALAVMEGGAPRPVASYGEGGMQRPEPALRADPPGSRS